MKTKLLNQFLLISVLALASACNGVGTADFKEAAVGTGGAQTGDGTDSSISFAGITSTTGKTDSTVTLHWTAHADAVAYDVFDTTSGTPIYKSTVAGQASNQFKLDGLTPNTNYKFRVRMKNSLGSSDANTADFSVSMNLAPDVPSTPTLHTPATSPNFDTRPILTVGGVKKGDTIRIFSDDTCNTEIGFKTVTADGATSVEVQATNPLTVQTYNFYANSTNTQGHASACTGTGNFVEYIVNACPATFVPVPGNTDLNVGAFCVMKYEAKAQYMNAGVAGTVVADGGNSLGSNWSKGSIYHPVNNTTGYRPVSQADQHPWRFVDATDAKDACLNLGAGFDLITNAEWMTIGWNVEARGSNWSNGNVGDGCLFRGNNGTAGACGYNGADPEAGTGRDNKAKLTLSNNEEIWDFAGNVWEWADWSHPTVSATTGTGFLRGPTTCSASAVEIPLAGCVPLADDDYLPANPASIAPASYNSTYGLGRFWASTGGAALRGGAWNNGTGTGVFALYLNHAPSVTSSLFGFRCVYRP